MKRVTRTCENCRKPFQCWPDDQWRLCTHCMLLAVLLLEAEASQTK